MSWYDDAWAYRAAITVDNSGAAATVDVSFTFPTDWDHFWNNVQSDGDDIRLVSYNGRTLLTFDHTGFNATTRAGTFEVDAYALTATAGMYNMWVYYGNAAATDATSAVAIASAVNAYVELGKPTGPWIVPVGPERPGSTRPRVELAKSAAERGIVWWDVTSILQRRRNAFESSDLLEEVYSAQLTVTTGGAAQAGMVENTSNRFLWWNRRMYVGTPLLAGTDGTDYTLSLSLQTRTGTSANNRTLNPRAWLKVRDVDEA